MKKFIFSKKTKSFLIMASFFFLGFISTGIARDSLRIEKETTYIAFLIFPLLIYVAVSYVQSKQQDT